MSSKLQDFELNQVETIIYCGSLSFRIQSRYTLNQIISGHQYFECPHTRVSRRGNLCCNARGGNRCLTYRELQSDDPPAWPVESIDKHE